MNGEEGLKYHVTNVLFFALEEYFLEFGQRMWEYPGDEFVGEDQSQKSER